MNDCSKVLVSTPDLQHLSIGHVKLGKRTELLNAWWNRRKVPRRRSASASLRSGWQPG